MGGICHKMSREEFIEKALARTSGLGTEMAAVVPSKLRIGGKGEA